MKNNGNAKMDWLVKKYLENECEYQLHKTHEIRGTAVLPTGAGKSGIVYEDIIWKIDHANENEKIVFNLSAPILSLEEQFMNDLIIVLGVTHRRLADGGKFMFFVNSSADGNDYNASAMNADVKPFSKDIGDFKKSKVAQFAFVASCHKSLHKFAEKMDYIKSFAKVVTYIDEAHLVISDKRDDEKYEKLSKNNKIAWNSLEQLCKGYYLYALTATPDAYVTKIINDSVGKKDSKHYIINVPATDLIEKNIILPPKIWFSNAGNNDDEKISPELCLGFMESVKEENPNICHKILVTCSNTDNLVELRSRLQQTDYKVFSTCSREGTMQTNGDCEEEIDAVDFINEIDNYDGDCFVLHIKQLTQGIDIKSLTDCIFYNGTSLQSGVKRIIVQTIGRTLRPMMGERGIAMENRIKKNGNVLMVVCDKYYEEYTKQMAAFVYHYYGSKNGTKVFGFDPTKDYGGKGKIKVVFGNSNKYMDDDLDDYKEQFIEELVSRMETYVREHILPQYELFRGLMDEESFKDSVDRDIAIIKNEFSYYYNKEYKTDELLNQTDFIQTITEILEKYGIAA